MTPRAWLAHLLALGTPRPRAFFRWIAVLASTIAALAPFLTGGAL